jgi:hypothetical protein
MIDSLRIEVPQIEIMIHHNMKMILLQQMASPVILKTDLMNISKTMKRNVHLIISCLPGPKASITEETSGIILVSSKQESSFSHVT